MGRNHVARAPRESPVRCVIMTAVGAGVGRAGVALAITSVGGAGTVTIVNMRGGLVGCFGAEAWLGKHLVGFEYGGV